MVIQRVDIRLLESRQLAVLVPRRSPERTILGFDRGKAVLQCVVLQLGNGVAKQRLDERPLVFLQHRYDHVATPAVQIVCHMNPVPG